MSASGFNLIVVFVLSVASGLFVMSELAILSARKVRLQQAANQGNRGARIALKLASNPNNFLAAGQIGITLITIIVGTLGEKTLSELFREGLEPTSFPKRYLEGFCSVLAVVLVTYLTLIISELVPKRLALNAPEGIAARMAAPMSLFAKVATPIVYLLNSSTEVILKILGIRPSTEPQVTEEEIKVMIEQGTEAGMFEQAEEDIMKRVFQLGDRRVSSIMTPRPEIIWLDVEDSEEEIRQTLREESHARFPVCRDGLDELLGIVQVYNLLRGSMDHQDHQDSQNGDHERLNISHSLRAEALQAPLFVPESTRALKVLEMFKQTGDQMAFVVDEYGVIQGLVTLTDILQALVGDLPSAEELQEPQAVQREDGSWLFDGMIPIYQFKEVLNIEAAELPGEHRGNYQTLGGFVVMHLGRIPRSADHFIWGDYRFEVVDMDGNRVDKVMVSVDLSPTT
jgi:putative hemolysin